MGFYDVLDQVLDLLRRRGRVTYRALKREFELDDTLLEDLKAEIIWVWLFFDDVHLMISKCGARLGRCMWSD
jgi:hypothetical protein